MTTSGGRKRFGRACRTAAGLCAEYRAELRKLRLREPEECCIRCNSAHFSQDCNGGSYQTITAFIADLFADGGDGILQFQDGTPALTSAQWTELDAALAKVSAPAPATASSAAPSPAPTSTPAEGTPAPATATPAQPSPSPHGCAAGNQAPAAAPPRDWLAAAGRVGLRLRGRACFDSLQSLGAKVSPRSADSTSPTPVAVAARRKPSWR